MAYYIKGFFNSPYCGCSMEFVAQVDANNEEELDSWFYSEMGNSWDSYWDSDLLVDDYDDDEIEDALIDYQLICKCMSTYEIISEEEYHELSQTMEVL